MLSRHPTAWPRNRRIVPAWVAAALALVLGLPRAEASASSASIVAGHGPATEGSEHGHHCKCRMHCKAACCCVVKDELLEHAAPAPIPSTPTPPSDPSGPCLKSAPCGGAPIPGATSGVPVGPPAVPAAGAAIRPTTAGMLVSAPPAALPPSAALARIDEPPESSRD